MQQVQGPAYRLAIRWQHVECVELPSELRVSGTKRQTVDGCGPNQGWPARFGGTDDARSRVFVRCSADEDVGHRETRRKLDSGVHQHAYFPSSKDAACESADCGLAPWAGTGGDSSRPLSFGGPLEPSGGVA